MIKNDLAHFLDPLQLSEWQYHPVVESTNDIALDWAKQGAPDWSLVIADQQTKGRGRNDRQWVTRPGVSLAISLVLRPTPQERNVLPRFTALAALGLIRSLSGVGLRAEIKWPNDVLLERKKVAGVLVETSWREEELEALVIGMGVNVKPEALPPQAMLRYPAISVEEALGTPINRWDLLAAIISEMRILRPGLATPDFMKAWNVHLAFRGELMPIRFPDDTLREMTILGVAADGQLALGDRHGNNFTLAAGEIAAGQ